MDAVKVGGNRQELHESIRFYLLIEVGSRVKDNGLTSNLVDLIAANPNFKLDREELDIKLTPQLHIGQ